MTRRSPEKTAARVKRAEAALADAIRDRDTAVRELSAQGMTRRAVADRFGITPGRVQQIVDRMIPR
jgi:transposase